MERVSVIVNPNAAGGGCMGKYLEAKKELMSQGLEVIEYISARPGHITELTRKAVQDGAKTVILAGGDGTLREALSELVYQETQVFLFPFGTGNDFARFAGIATEPCAAAAQFLKGTARLVDAAMANESYFMNVAGLGFDVDVLERTAIYKDRFKDKRAYHLGLVSALVNLRNRPVTIRGEGFTRKHHFIVVSAGNGTFVGGGIAALPKADMQDGKLDICVMHDVRLHRIPSVLGKFTKGRHLDLKETDYFRSETVTVETETPMSVQLDGDIIEKTPVTFRALPGAIRLIL